MYLGKRSCSRPFSSKVAPSVSFVESLCFVVGPVAVSAFILAWVTASNPLAPSRIAAFRGPVDGVHPLWYHDAETCPLSRL